MEFDAGRIDNWKWSIDN